MLLLLLPPPSTRPPPENRIAYLRRTAAQTQLLFRLAAHPRTAVHYLACLASRRAQRNNPPARFLRAG